MAQYANHLRRSVSCWTLYPIAHVPGRTDHILRLGFRRQNDAARPAAGNLLARLYRRLTRHSSHPSAPESRAALVDAGDEGMRDSQFHLCMVVRHQQRAVGLALIAEGADLNRPLAGRGGTVM